MLEDRLTAELAAQLQNNRGQTVRRDRLHLQRVEAISKGAKGSDPLASPETRLSPTEPGLPGDAGGNLITDRPT